MISSIFTVCATILGSCIAIIVAICVIARKRARRKRTAFEKEQSFSASKVLEKKPITRQTENVLCSRSDQPRITTNGKTAFIEWSDKDISGSYKTSKSGEFYIICDTMIYPNNDSGDDIFYAVVFSEAGIAHCKKLSHDYADDFDVFDDGAYAILMEDYFALYGADDNQVLKKKFSAIRKVWRTDDMLSFFVQMPSGKCKLFIFKTDRRDLLEKQIPDIESECTVDGKTTVQTLSASSIEPYFDESKFIFIYDDEKTAVAFDICGQRITVDPEEIDQIVSERHERNYQSEASKAKRQIEYWTERKEKSEIAKNYDDVGYCNEKLQHYLPKLERLLTQRDFGVRQ